VGLGCFLSFLIYTQSVGLLGLGISPSQVRYLHRATETQNKRRQISRIRTHDLSVRADEDGSCLRSHGHCDRQFYLYLSVNEMENCISFRGDRFTRISDNRGYSQRLLVVLEVSLPRGLITCRAYEWSRWNLCIGNGWITVRVCTIQTDSHHIDFATY
jgi:hypothetical protein